jgi:hypothetical protein
MLWLHVSTPGDKREESRQRETHTQRHTQRDRQTDRQRETERAVLRRAGSSEEIEQTLPLELR